MMIFAPNPARDPSQPLLTSGDALSGCLDVAQQLGFDVQFYLRRNGIDPAAATSGNGLLTFQALSDFLEDVAEAEGLSDFGFRLGVAQPPLQYGVISQLPMISPTAGDALRNFIRYQKIYSQSSHWELLIEQDIATVRRHDVSPVQRARPQMAAFSITLAFKSIKAVIGPNWSPIGIYLDNDVGPAIAEMRRYFRAPVFCNSVHNEIAFIANELNRQIPTSDPDLLSVLKQYFDQLLQGTPRSEDLSSKVFHMIRANLGDTRCTLDWIAASLRMHPRTLQRMLVAEGTTFRALLREATMEMADHLLHHTRIPITEISAMLGYRNQSAFSRAFEQAHGTPPSALRRKFSSVG